MPLRPGESAPYAPPAAVLGLIAAYRDRSLPTPFTGEVLVRAGVSESLVNRTIKTLEGLELIDTGGNPTAEFEGLRRATADEFTQRLAAVIRSVYAEVFQFVDPARDTPERIADQFRVFEPIGQRGRMVTLFMGLCEAAGIIPDGGTRKQAPTGAPKKSATTPKAKAQSPANAARGLGKATSYAETPQAANGLPPIVQAAIASIPLSGWTTAEREKFMKFFGTVLDFAIPVRTEGEQVETDTDDDE